MSNLKAHLITFLTTLIKEANPDQTVQSIDTYPEETTSGKVAFPFIDGNGEAQTLLIHDTSFEGIFNQILSGGPITAYKISLREDDYDGDY